MPLNETSKCSMIQLYFLTQKCAVEFPNNFLFQHPELVDLFSYTDHLALHHIHLGWCFSENECCYLDCSGELSWGSFRAGLGQINCEVSTVFGISPLSALSTTLFFLLHPLIVRIQCFPYILGFSLPHFTWDFTFILVLSCFSLLQ